MKKAFLISLVSVLAIGFILSGVFQAVMAAEKPKYGGILKAANSKTPVYFGYPPKIRSADQDLACESLETLVLTNPQQVITEPNLATEWEVSPDGKTYTFKLRKGVKFHDGTDFNAQAVKYNMEIWMKDPGTTLRTLASVDVIDDYTVRLNFSEFDNLVLYELSSEAYIISPTAMEKNGVKWAETHPVGTGPFKFKEYERNVVVRYERFKDYWRKGLPYLDGLEKHIIKDSMTQMASLRAGEIHLIRNVHHEHAKLLKKEGYNIFEYPDMHINLFGDSKNPDSPLSNKKVREAIEYAIDKEGIAEMSYGYYKPLYQMVLSDNPFYDPGLKPRKYDPKKARKLLAEAGYPKGIKITVSHFVRHWAESWVAMQASMAKAGIDMKIDSADRPKTLMLRTEGGLKNGLTHMQLRMIPYPRFVFKNFLISSAPFAPDMARPAGFDDLVDKALMAKDLGTQKAIFKQTNKMIYDEVMCIPLNVEPRINVFHKSVQNYKRLNPYGGPFFPHYVDMWLSKK